MCGAFECIMLSYYVSSRDPHNASNIFVQNIDKFAIAHTTYALFWPSMQNFYIRKGQKCENLHFSRNLQN